MEEIDLSGGLKALRLQDLPAKYVVTFMQLPSGAKEVMGINLFTLAAGSGAEDRILAMSYRELAMAVEEWMVRSLASGDDSGAGVDWSELLR